MFHGVRSKCATARVEPVPGCRGTALSLEFLLCPTDELSCPPHGEVGIGMSHEGSPMVRRVLQLEEAFHADRKVSTIRGRSL